jgi:hypothetical protein
MGVDSPSALRGRHAELRLEWWPVLAFLPARTAFSFASQGLAAAFFYLVGVADPWRRAAETWLVHTTIADILCLAVLALLLRREGLRLRQLFGTKRSEGIRQLGWTPLYLLLVAPGAIAAHLITTAFYGSQLPPMISIVDLPPAGVVYAMSVWPVVWVVTEQFVYLGYLLPRIEALTGKTWLAVVVVVLFWGLQHIAIPFIGDARYLISRPLAATAAVSLFPVVYVLGRRRLVPLIGAHYIADLSTAFLAAALPLINE